MIDAASSARRWHERFRSMPWLHLACLAVACAVLLAGALSFYPFMADDGFISLRYARRLLDGHGLTWTDGPRVEGYSNLLWILGCAFLGELGLDLVWAARALGVATAWATLAVLAWTYRKAPLLVCIAPLALLALAGPMAVWTLGGLEQPLVAFCLALAIHDCLPLVSNSADDESTAHPVRAGVFFGLLALTRPDAILFGAAVAMVLLASKLRGQRKLRTLLKIALPVVLLISAQLAFRALYYGDFMPNTGRAKLAFTSMHSVRGSYQVWDGLVALRGIFLPCLADIAILLPKHKLRMALLIAPMLMWLGYWAMVGGDIFPAWRQFVPLLVLAAFVVGDASQALMQRGAKATWIAAAALACAAALLVYDEGHDGKVEVARQERWEWHGQVIGKLLESAFADKAPLLALDPAGAVPYFSGLPALDMLGLNDRFLATHPPEDFGQSFALGHELGNGPYVLGRKPDLVLFCLPAGGAQPCFRSGRELSQLDAFREGYVLAAFEGSVPRPARSLIWVRRDSERIGVSRSQGRIIVPGYLVEGSDAVSRLDGAGKLVTEIAGKGRVAIHGIVIERGSWQLSVNGDGDALRVVVTTETSGSQPLPLQLQIMASATVDLRIETIAQTPARLYQLVLERMRGTKSE